ncbi:hypothetical protein HETIRDRAFT_120462 [Heterobasidion irregulare TC 32-1]|uniref:Uncharacterized protein n=1 Tax=Heterobasidion irregulare (strain TC 32-1) TaxID=747525 RepID=W4JN68_HETIT|nr:uncharacterized protein HETIRDRAFT_120462 [Heterobasidion irregulare TC 32-1]ETW75007.1 hypothetical protein HETIRDRAFT_120462 [Heterobasidion irregulare TC 32-1]
MSSILSALKAKLREYMLTLPDGTTEYEDYEAWMQGFAKRVAVFDHSAPGEEVPKLAAWVAEAERGLDHIATNDWLSWGLHILPQRAARFAELQQQQAAEKQALAEEFARVAAAEREAGEAREAWAATAHRSAEEDRQRRREALVEAMFSGLVDLDKGNRQLAVLEAESADLLPLFLPSPSPAPTPAASSSLLPLPADADLAFTTEALDHMSVDSTLPTPSADSKGKQRAGAVVLPLRLGTGRMSTIRSPVERNGAGKLLQDPPGLLPGDVLAEYACHRYATEFATVAPRCYTRPGQVSCLKCANDRKECSFQPGWTLKEKGKAQAKAKSGAKSVENERLMKKRKMEVLVPERSAGESIAWSKAVRSRKPVKCLPTTTQHLPVPSRSSRPTRPTSTAAPSPELSRLLPSVARGVASKIRYQIAVAEGLCTFLACSITMWRAELEALEARSGPLAPLDVVLVEDSSEADDSGRLELGDFVPDD